MNDNEFLHELQIEVEAELSIAEASRPREEMELPVDEWRFDPVEAERMEIGLHGLHDAVCELEAEHPRGGDVG